MTIRRISFSLALPLLLVTTVLFTACPSNVANTSLSSTTSTQDDTSPTAAKPSPPTVSVLPNPEVPRMAADELKQLIDTNADFVLVDTRDASAYYNGRIKGAKNIPSYPGGQPLFAKLKTLPINKLIVFYCS